MEPTVNCDPPGAGCQCRIREAAEFLVGIRTTELSAIFFSTFENVRGTVIAHQYPPNYVSPAQFREISNAVLPRAELAFRLITVEAFQHYVIGCPQRIEGDQYQRNTLQFNICLVLKPKPCSNVDDVTRWRFWTSESAGGLRLPIQAAYEALALKINRYFYAVEQECAFLSGRMERNCGEDVELPCLDSIFQQLHSDGTCVLDIENCGSLYLRLSPEQSDSVSNRLLLEPEELTPLSTSNSVALHMYENEAELIRRRSSAAWVASQTSPQPEWEVADENVFVLVAPPTPREPGQLGPIKLRWEPIDFVSRRILPYLDGCHCLPELAQLAKVDVTIARLCLIHLVRAGVVRSLPAPTFLLNSPPLSSTCTHAITMPGWLGLPRLTSLLTDHELASACLEAVHCHPPSSTDNKDVRCSVVDVFRVYAMLCGSPNFSLPHLVSANPHLLFVDATSVRERLSSFAPMDFEKSAERPQLSLLRLVQFGEVNGLIHRLQCYPISDQVTGSKSDSDAVNSSLNDTHQVDASAFRTPKQPSHLVLSPIQSSSSKRVGLSWTTTDEQLWVKARSSIMDGLHSTGAIECLLHSEPSSNVMAATVHLTSKLLCGLHPDTSTEQPLTIPDPVPGPNRQPRTNSVNLPIPSDQRLISTPLSKTEQNLRRLPHHGRHDSMRSVEETIRRKSELSTRNSNSPNEFIASVPDLYLLWR
ncbi:hypothetical protein T265_08788 [Opisthorchis viverrini]|uniref:Nitrogen permease regulator 2-like protein n=1 Tax=Opisthorchis viverrini TaxID=6198 RepID=A0A075A784_OPIVI|nr:hypothetical protein T265_08788 [Opisthorchis viverrini]KER23304.1 hypothetical protein T265_08788 [Opisthorchis viverrini]